jgi:hypothetical protein
MQEDLEREGRTDGRRGGGREGGREGGRGGGREGGKEGQIADLHFLSKEPLTHQVSAM